MSRELSKINPKQAAKYALLTTILIIASSPVFANDGKIVYYCISDKMVGIQENTEKSGYIKPVKPNFTLAYFPAEIVINSNDPLYKSPRIAANPFGENNTNYYLMGEQMLFNSSSQNLSETLWFKRYGKEQNMKELFNEQFQLRNNDPFGAYGFANFLGSKVFQLWPIEKNKLYGTVTSTELIDKVNINKFDFKIYSYSLHFTCTRY